LIYPDDAKAFSTMMDVTWQSLHRNAVDKQTKQYWFGKLQHIPLGDVERIFDAWLKSNDELPTLKEILKLVAPKESFHKALGVVRDQEVCQEGLKKIEKIVSSGFTSKRDLKEWARDLISGKKQSNWDGAIAFAHEALVAKA
jgi:hypothetical protein